MRGSKARRKHGNPAGNPTNENYKARERTSLIGATIYQPALEPTPRGLRLIEALDSIQ